MAWWYRQNLFLAVDPVFEGVRLVRRPARADAERYPVDVPLRLHEHAQLAVGLDQVRANFDRYGLLDDQVRFVPGWFRDTLPGLGREIDAIAVLRLDGDMYESTIDALTHLEPPVSPGGFVIVDDYGGIEACRQAVTDHREAHGITAPLHEVDWTAVWWRKPDGDAPITRAGNVDTATRV